jgi:hypothetical protein
VEVKDHWRCPIGSGSLGVRSPTHQFSNPTFELDLAEDAISAMFVAFFEPPKIK